MGILSKFRMGQYRDGMTNGKTHSTLILRSVFVSIASVVLFLAILTLSITAVITTPVTTTAVHSSWTTTHSIKWLKIEFL